MEEIKNEETLKEEESPKSEDISQNEEHVTNENVAVAEEPQVIEETSDNEDISKNEKKDKSRKFENISEKIKIFEPFLRVIEVIFIGILSIAIAINANTIADKANEIADAQLKSEQMEKQPIFSIKNECIDDNEKKHKVTITKSNNETAENISIDVVTCLKVKKDEPSELLEGAKTDYSDSIRIMLLGYMIENQDNDKSVSFFYNENLFTNVGAYDVYIHPTNDKYTWCYNLTSIFKIVYKDYMGKIRIQYYSIYGEHLSDDHGYKLYDENNRPDEIILSKNLSYEYVESLIESDKK